MAVEKRSWLWRLRRPSGALGFVFWSGGASAPATPGFVEPVGPPPPGLEKATFASGCFWCSEAVFSKVEGRLLRRLRLFGRHSEETQLCRYLHRLDGTC